MAEKDFIGSYRAKFHKAKSGETMTGSMVISDDPNLLVVVSGMEADYDKSLDGTYVGDSDQQPEHILASTPSESYQIVAYLGTSPGTLHGSFKNDDDDEWGSFHTI